MPADKEKTTTQEPNTNDGFDIEPLLQALGSRGIGFYQITQMTLQMSSLFGVAFSILSVVFIGYQPPYQCAEVNMTKLDDVLDLERNVTDDVSVVYEKCSIQVSANRSGELQVYSLPCIEGYQYDGPKDMSFFTEWDLTCDYSGLTELTQTLMMVGQAVGAFLFTSLADRFGRKSVHVPCSLALLVVAVANGLAPNYVFFTFCRVATGALQQGTGLVAFTMFIELLPKWLRGMAGLTDGVIWASAVMMLPLLAYLMQDFTWRYLQYTLAAFSAYSILLPCFMDESLRWLVANGKKTEAERVLKRASRQNNVQYTKVHAALEELFRSQSSPDMNTTPVSLEFAASVPSFPAENGDQESANERVEKLLRVGDPINGSVAEKDGPVNGSVAEKNEKHKGSVAEKEPFLDEPVNGDVTDKEPMTTAVKNGGSDNMKASKPSVTRYTILDVLKHKVLLKTAFIIWYLWIGNSLAYYGLTLTSAQMAGNRFFNFFLQVMVELPAYVTVYFALRRFGRRNVGCAFLIIASVSLLLSAVLLATVTGPAIGPTTNVLSLIGKFGISGSFCNLFIFCPELFPTNLRTAGLGMSSAVARIGGMLAPFSSNLAAIAVWAPGLVFGAMSALGCFVILQLPETSGRPLPTTIQQMKAWHKRTPSQIQKAEIIIEPKGEKGIC
ncbi:organic cation transporter protein-like [Littorina saxatilis]|uniref:Major facilitator superfamily (MFS) profile domain-containing protein n=1 Tax=Littorina saxatilis TaxID=31220 RepID=A0AAN9C304_9CAEN